jgi:hypothetical protein
MLRFRWPRTLMLLAVLLASMPASFTPARADVATVAPAVESTDPVQPVVDTRAGVVAAVLCGLAAGAAAWGVIGAVPLAIVLCTTMVLDAMDTPDRG